MSNKSNNGAELIITVHNPNEMRSFINRLVNAGIVRCVSPERESLCNEPAVNVFWNDIAEWYPCCAKHTVIGDQWTGRTKFSPHNLSIAIIPDLAEKWLAILSEDKRKLITIGTYERG